MNLDTVLNVAIGLVFMYLLLSLLTTSVGEMIAAALSWRAKTLTSGLQNLLNGPNGKALYADFVSHPLLQTTQCLSGKNGPSYLSAQTFTTVLLDKVAPGLPEKAGELFDHIKKGIEGIPDPMVKGALEALTKEAQGDVEKLKQQVATWFDDAMDRLSGTYKRKVQMLLLALGVAVSVSLNADTFMVAKALWQNGALSADIARQASNFADNQTNAGYADAKAQLQGFPIGWNRQDLPSDLFGWLIKVFGLLATAVAVALGAPFWFDLLRRVNAIRSAGPKPARGIDGKTKNN